MADKKISALTAASTPLAGTEVLPIVQGGSTVKVSVDNLTAGRDISASGGTFTKAGVTQVTIANTTGTTKNTQLIYADNVGSKWRLGMDVATNNNTVNFQLYSDVGSASYLTMDSSGNLSVDVGNVVIGTSGKGIDFSATSGSGTSELFSDYEEGTYTPTWNGGSITTVVSAYYTKIGRQVTVIADVILGTSASASVSEITVPFTALSASNWGSGGVAYTTYGATLFVSFDATTSKINFRATANTAALTCAGVATSRFAFTLTYFV